MILYLVFGPAEEKKKFPEEEKEFVITV